MLPFTLAKAVQTASAIIKKHRIDAVIGFGGFVTFPGGVAAKLAGVPIVIHEQNAIAGMSNKFTKHHQLNILVVLIFHKYYQIHQNQARGHLLKIYFSTK